MPWVKIDDHFDEHPKHAQAGPLGWALWLAGLAYCNRNLTDGFIPWTTARTLVAWTFLDDATDERGQCICTIAVCCGAVGQDVTSELVIDRLLAAGLWENVDGGYYVHDYPAYQPTKAQVLAERAQKVAAGQAGGQASAQARAQAVAQAAAQANSNPVPVPVPVPVPNPDPDAADAALEREGSGEGEGSAASADGTRTTNVRANAKRGRVQGKGGGGGGGGGEQRQREPE
jgi:hypothetical protein